MAVCASLAMEEITCGCGVTFMAPERWLNRKREKGGSLYCPNGCSLTFGESKLDRLRRENERLTQRLAQKDDAIRRQRDLTEKAERSAAAYKGHFTKVQNRVSRGVCPCCNRSFTNLQRHMKAKHPDWKSDA